MTDVKGRTAFITGGANGIGLGIARALAAAGVKLGLADLDMSALDRAKAELDPITQVEIVQLDVRGRQAFVDAADRVEGCLGPVSLLLNNAGVTGAGGIDDLSYDLWEWTIGINLWGVVNGVQTFLPRMMGRAMGGHVVNTASASGLVGGTATIPYCTAKAGVVGLSESLRAELKGTGIGVSVLCPGPVATEILSHSASRMRADTGLVKSAELRDRRMSTVLERGVQPDEVGRMVLAGMEAGSLYIHTDKVILHALEERHQEIVGAMPDGVIDAFTADIASSLSKRRAP